MSFGAEANRIFKKLIKGNPQGFFRIDKDEEKFIQDNFVDSGNISIDGQKTSVYVKLDGENIILDKERTPLQLFIIVRNVSTNIKQCMLMANIKNTDNIAIPIIFPSEEAKWLFSGIMRAPDMNEAYGFLMKEKLNEELEASLKSETKTERKLKI